MCCLAVTPASAVIILDSTWADNGGSRRTPNAGFGAHEALAQQDQFAAIFGLWDGEEYGGSGTWIGNDDEGHGYILTAAHNFDGGGGAGTWVYYSRAEGEYQGIEVYIHPDYDPEDEEQGTSGYDLAIVKLDAPVEDAGDTPYLYAGDQELGAVMTITGYGSRGIGSRGEDNRFYDFDYPGPAAARNVIDDVDTEMENNLLVDLDRENGNASVMGDDEPFDEMEGILGSGDSGGAAWIETENGWAIAGINVWGDDATYGSTSGFARVSTQLNWIESIFPDYWARD